MSSNKADGEWNAKTLFNPINLVVFLAAFIVCQAMRMPFRFLKAPISHALNLQSLSTSWSKFKWLGLSILWIAALGFLKTVTEIIGEFSAQPMTLTHWLNTLSGIALALFFAFLFNIFFWLQHYAEDPELQKTLAGMRAERHVQQIIEWNHERFPLSRSLHGALFVFNAGSADEFSLETDHILVTQRNIFVIETKYKSGTISAGADASNWVVSTNNGDRTMRNALKQVKNAARVLGRQCDLPCDVIPLVAIKGNDVKIIDGPSNVVAAGDLLKMIDAFESVHKDAVVNPQAVLAQLAKYASTDPAAMERHVKRAELARAKAEQADIVNAASIQ